MRAMASQITGVSIVCSNVCSCANQRQHQSCASLAFVRGINRSPVNSPYKGSVTRKMFPFDDVIMEFFGWNHTLNVFRPSYYNDVIKSAMASQITSFTIVYSTVYSGADQRKHQSSASLAFVWGIHWSPVNPPHKWTVTRKEVFIWWRHHDPYFLGWLCLVASRTVLNSINGRNHPNDFAFISQGNHQK